MTKKQKELLFWGLIPIILMIIGVYHLSSIYKENERKQQQIQKAANIYKKSYLPSNLTNASIVEKKLDSNSIKQNYEYKITKETVLLDLPNKFKTKDYNETRGIQQQEESRLVAIASSSNIDLPTIQPFIDQISTDDEKKRTLLLAEIFLTSKILNICMKNASKISLVSSGAQKDFFMNSTNEIAVINTTISFESSFNSYNKICEKIKDEQFIILKSSINKTEDTKKLNIILKIAIMISPTNEWELPQRTIKDAVLENKKTTSPRRKPSSDSSGGTRRRRRR